MKSSVFGWEASFAIELLAVSFLGDDEFCANSEFVAANAINIRVITRNLFWFAGILPVERNGVGRGCCPDFQQHGLSSMYDSNGAVSRISQTGSSAMFAVSINHC